MGKQFQPDMFYSTRPAGSTCEHCGGYAAPNERTGKPKRFCSFECNSRFNQEKEKQERNRRQECSWCGKLYIGNKVKIYCSAKCSKESKKALDRARKWESNPDKRPINLSNCRCCGKPRNLNKPGMFCSNVCWKRWDRHQIERTEPLPNVVGIGKKPISEKAYRTLAQQNARQAWQYWLKEKAPDWWVQQYYEATGKPWRNPRLSEAEKYRIRYALDEEYAISERLRRQITKARKRDGVSEVIRGAIRRNGASALVRREFGYTIAELKDHLERQFTRGMNWDKFKIGEMHIDHIVPQKEFDLSDDDQWRKCWCLSNLRPMWARDNIRKGARLEVLL